MNDKIIVNVESDDKRQERTGVRRNESEIVVVEGWLMKIKAKS